MSKEEQTTGWHTTSDSASGVAHYWKKVKYSRRRSLCGRVTEAKMMQETTESITECSRCKKALAAEAAQAPQAA